MAGLRWLMADAGDLADKTAARDAAAWLAHTTRTRLSDARADLVLAAALDRERPVLAAAMREGAATLAQAHVINRALTALPRAVDVDTVALAEARLVAYAAEFGPKEARPSRSADPRCRRTRDRRSSRGGATRRARGARRRPHPAHVAASGRRHHADLGTGARRGRHAVRHLSRGLRQPARTHGRGPRRPGRRPVHPDALSEADGQALAQFLETIDPFRMPIHGGDATTVIVTLPLASLQSDLGAADLVGAGWSPPKARAASPATASPQARPDASPAPRRSCPPSWAARACRSTSDAPAVCSIPPSARRCCSATGRAARKAATSPAPGARPIIAATPGGPAAAPTSTRGAPLRPPPPSDPRRRLPHRATPQWGRQVPPAQIGAA